jgi:hypothetical protein
VDLILRCKSTLASAKTWNFQDRVKRIEIQSMIDMNL